MGTRRSRDGWTVAAAVLAALGVILVYIAVRGAPDEPSAAAAPPAVAPDASAPVAPQRTPDTLTRGPLLATSPPIHLSIPALKVSVPLIGLGQNADGTMQVPADATTVGWYTKAPTPGSLGPAVLAGHVNYAKRPGTFARLSTMKAGDKITVARKDGSTAVFVVAKTARYPKDRFPSNAVYGAIDHAGLRLITCGGDFDQSTGNYLDNIVVYATLLRAG